MIKKFSWKILIVLLFVWVFSLSVNAQKKQTEPHTGKISCPEKRWAAFHPFIAKKSYVLTGDAFQAADSIKNSVTLDGDINGGQVDAFKHAYWMALLTQHIKWKKAVKLGKVHEKGNYRTYKKGIRKGFAETHDKISSDMDLWNNKKGIEIGRALKETDRIIIQQVVIDSIHAGKMRVIKKNSSGHYLDCGGTVIPSDSLSGKWENDKCLVPSNFSLDSKK